MDRNLAANLAGAAGAVAMLGVSLISRKLGFSYGDTMAEDMGQAGVAAMGLDGEATESQEQALGLGAHLGFSMSSAMLYGRVRDHLNLPGPVAGALFGLAVWGLNAAGIAPMLGIRNAPWKQDEAKAITTLLAHVAFGAVVGLLYDEIVDDEDEG